MIEVYKTNVQNRSQACKILNSLSAEFPLVSINFDLKDCDKILRITGIKQEQIQEVINGVNKLGFHCRVLD